MDKTHGSQSIRGVHVGPNLTGGLNGNLGLRQLVPSLRPGFLKGAPDDPLEGLVRQTIVFLQLGQTRSPGHELVNGSRHMRQRRDLAL